MSSDRKTGRPSGCVFGILTILLGMALTIATGLYQRRYYPVCNGGLSGGFPVVYVCDSSGASGTPESSWGRIDFADWVNVNPIAFVMDLMLYSALVTLAWLILSGLAAGGLGYSDHFRSAMLLCLLYLTIFLFAFMAFQTNSLRVELAFPRTPMPVVFTSTPMGTPPPPVPAASPIPTIGHTP